MSHSLHVAETGYNLQQGLIVPADVAGQDVFQQGLVVKDITYESILEVGPRPCLCFAVLKNKRVLSFVHVNLKEHDRVSNTSSRRFQGNVLGYVTPW